MPGLNTCPNQAKTDQRSHPNRPLLTLHLEHETSLPLHNSDIPLLDLQPRLAIHSSHRLGRHTAAPALPDAPQHLRLPNREVKDEGQGQALRIESTKGASSPRPDSSRGPAAKVPDHRPQRQAGRACERHARPELEHPAVGWRAAMEQRRRKGEHNLVLRLGAAARHLEAHREQRRPHRAVRLAGAQGQERGGQSRRQGGTGDGSRCREEQRKSLVGRAGVDRCLGSTEAY